MYPNLRFYWVVIFYFKKLFYEWFQELACQLDKTAALNCIFHFAFEWLAEHRIQFSVRSLLGRCDRGLLACGESWQLSSHVTSSHTMSWHTWSSWHITQHLSVSLSRFSFSPLNPTSVFIFWPLSSLPLSALCFFLFICLSLSLCIVLSANFSLIEVMVLIYLTMLQDSKDSN